MYLTAASKCIRQKLIELQGEVDESIITVVDFNILVIGNEQAQQAENQ